MRIYSMTATFGKLDHETLTLQPGLNVIEAPNEWGKSTWCAFLVTMLYGLDTRERTRKGSLADKERFAPWSGSPMSGRIDLCWKGRDITIERRAKGRIPMGELSAYETATGVEVPELTAADCGRVLLGVERSVFTRSAFIRSADMPVTQDEELLRRLDALVTTGDDSGQAQVLGRKLRELKNKVRYNRTGLLPEAQSRQVALEQKLQELDGLSLQSLQLRRRKTALEHRIGELENHEAALRHAASLEDLRRVEEAEAAEKLAREQYDMAEAACCGLPQRGAAVEALERQKDRQRRWEQVQAKERSLPPIPQPPEAPEPFRDMDPADAPWQVQRDEASFYQLERSGRPLWWIALVLGLVLSSLGVVLAVSVLPMVGLCVLAVGLAALVVGVVSTLKARRQRRTAQSRRMALSRRYGSDDPDQWIALAHGYRDSWERYRRADKAAREARVELEQERIQLEQLPEDEHEDYAAAIAAWDQLAARRRVLEQSGAHLRTLRAVVKVVPAASVPDTLTETAQQTCQLLAQARQELQQLQLELGQCLGQMELLGDRETLRRELEAAGERVAQLEQTERALGFGLDALEQARGELQRRFAPRIGKQAQALFARLTGGRYDRLVMDRDLGIRSSAVGEDTLRSHLWRSEGTVDQLYLAVRLAVARELTPEAPLVLDDALIRFDDQRCHRALQILAQEAQQKQVIVFSCQGNCQMTSE
ncbi:MAG: AAA family ATPase [Oscillospiraceae bacterium]|nr:AAA family ATPase [Oscillospiraceae bacterium]